jgi:ABC-type dipeptide/oligopeptide/nickel transport system permease component
VILPALLAAAGALIAVRIVVPRVIVPAWRRGSLSDERAAVLVAVARGITLFVLVMAAVVAVNLPWVPGLLSAAAAGLLYAVIGWRGIRTMFRSSELNPRNPR